ncbi:mandelate racemase/muconate lactonizing enzyme family protein [Kocuria sp. NPDC057446]|uniref:mandelate racemase/muconate lactonizing enzyme family protein n=1 Tax=Kocuria sp. NPDC057446 TaxID=3346137 RepID=UPI003698C3C2
MKIATVEAIPDSIPYVHALHLASGAVHEADHVLVRITTDEGVVGTADTPPRPCTYGETQKSIVAVVEDVFAPQLVGLDVLDREKVQAVPARTVHNQTAKGAVGFALWGVIGQFLGQPVTRLPGGFTDSMRVSHMPGFKPAAELSVDADRGWSANEAMEVLRRTADLGLQSLEEPDDAREVLGRRRLVEHSTIPIAADESAPNLGEAAKEILTGGANLLAVKAARSGFTEAAKIVSTVDSVVFGAAPAHTSKRAGEPSNFLDMADDLLAEPVVIAGGRIRVPEVPGAGTAVDEDKLAHYRTDR